MTLAYTEHGDSYPRDKHKSPSPRPQHLTPPSNIVVYHSTHCSIRMTAQSAGVHARGCLAVSMLGRLWQLR